MVSFDHALKLFSSLSLLLNHGTILNYHQFWFCASRHLERGSRNCAYYLWRWKPQRRKLSLQAFDTIVLFFSGLNQHPLLELCLCAFVCIALVTFRNMVYHFTFPITHHGCYQMYICISYGRLCSSIVVLIFWLVLFLLCSEFILYIKQVIFNI